jgi:hypothetical protein
MSELGTIKFCMLTDLQMMNNFIGTIFVKKPVTMMMVVPGAETHLE